MSGFHSVVIGGAGGIGRALVPRLQSAGHHVTIISRDRDNHENLDANCIIGDARDIDGLTTIVQKIGASQPVNGIVCLAGSILLKPAHMTSAAEWVHTLETNLTTAFACVHAAGKCMRGNGSIVLTSTVAAHTGLPNHEAIAAAKAGVEGLTRSAAATYASRGLRFNAVAPGLVDTPLANQITGSERALEHSRKMHPLGRIGQPDDVAAAIAWLLSSESDWITGQVLGIDGGLGQTRAQAK